MKYTIDVSGFINTEYRLKKDGKFKNFTGTHEKVILDDDFTFDNYGDAKFWKESHDFIEVEGKKIEVNSTSGLLSDPTVRVRPHRTGKPKQMYISLEELKSVLLTGNDNYNNSLVIDFDGFLHLVPFSKAINGPYAVRFETFGAGNGYVGSESSLNHIEGTYLALLQGWAIHLFSHDKVYRDYASNETKEETIEEILEAIKDL